MVKVKLKNGQVKEVTPNEAHGLIESGEGVLLDKNFYKTRQSVPKERKTR